MQITWHGQYTVKLSTKDTIVVMDPYATSEGLSPFRAKADVVVLTNPTDESMSNVSGIQGEPVVVSTPGEYSLRGLTLHAQPWYTEDNVERSLLLWQAEGMTVVHVGALNRELSDTELQSLERTNIDVLLVPVGGGGGLDSKQALKFITTIEPRVVVPIHHKLPKLKEDLESVDQFAKEVGVDPKQVESKLTLKASKLPQDDMETYILSA